MPKRPAENLKAIATSIAEIAATGTPDLALLKELFATLESGLGHSQQNKLLSQERIESEDTIGIYSPEERNGKIFYIRDKRYEHEFPLWCSQEEIAPKELSKKRVILLGESVARGYFYDPTYSCATLLQTFLNDSQDQVQFEVVDLARSSIFIHQLLDLYRSAMVLDPDVVVIFAGNNWLPDTVIRPEAISHIAKVLESGGSFEQIREIIQKCYEEVINTFIDTVGKEAAKKDIRVIFLIPEFNLKDWRAKTCFDRALLWHGSQKEFLKEMHKGEAALIEKRIEAVHDHAQRMIALSPSHPVGYELLAEYFLAKGDDTTAKEYLVKAMDCALSRLNVMPRTLSVVREQLIKIAPYYNVDTIDLRPLLASHAPSGIPDRELFMDYCHLSLKGLTIVMEKTASEILAKAGVNMLVSAEQLVQVDLKVLARAHFCAALHNAHYGPQHQVLEYHCSKAAEYEPEALSWMKWYVNIVTSKLPWDLNASYIKLLKSKVSRGYENGLQFLQIFDTMDLDLVQALNAVIGRYSPDFVQQAEGRRLGIHQLQPHMRTDLLHTRYHSNSYKTFLTRAYYFQAFDLQSRFFFFTTAGTDVVLSTTLRAPGKETRFVRVFVNEVEIGQLEIKNTWRHHDIIIPASIQRNDLNNVTIQWPDPENSASRRLDPLESDYDFVARNYYPLIGEIHSLSVELFPTFGAHNHELALTTIEVDGHIK
jgi:hypothetical protein